MTDLAPLDEPYDVEVGRYALRTFRVPGREKDAPLLSVASETSWSGGSMIASCLYIDHYLAVMGALPYQDRTHSAPHRSCRCGIYGTLTLDQLAREYGQYARHRVAVFAAEGTTFIGSKGLRTSAARVVAFWGFSVGERAFLHKHLPDAKCFSDIHEMLAEYDLPKFQGSFPAPYEEWWSPYIRVNWGVNGSQNPAVLYRQVSSPTRASRAPSSPPPTPSIAPSPSNPLSLPPAPSSYSSVIPTAYSSVVSPASLIDAEQESKSSLWSKIRGVLSK